MHAHLGLHEALRVPGAQQGAGLRAAQRVETLPEREAAVAHQVVQAERGRGAADRAEGRRACSGGSAQGEGPGQG